MRDAVLAAVMSLSMTTAATADRAADLPLLPMPAAVAMGVGSFSLAHAQIAAIDAGERAAGDRLRTLLGRSGGGRLVFASTGRIRFRRDSSIHGRQAYRLVITPTAVEVTAAGDAGLYYGAETLWQLIAASRSGRIPVLAINDRPAFAWRGVMLDSARHFQPVSYVEQLIDRMAMAKLNTLHWHLTDDQGWRIQIDRYPRLISVGAWRQEAGAAGTNPRSGKPVLYGGFYSKADIRAVVAFARKRHVTIVPEIEMPGHATAMIAAYPELASIQSPPTAPSHDWGILPNLLVPKDATFTFIDHVLDEVMALFPGRFIHLGGDEAVKDQWQANPFVQAKIKALGLKNADALQGWFTARVGRYLTAHGRRLIGWDEILGGEVPADAAVMSWHGIDGAVTAAKSGHDAVLAASPILYLDHIQSMSGDEPPGRAEIITWRQLYDFDPAPAGLTPIQRRHILGLQANLWTEHARTTEYADRMIWPRAAIVAEIAWSDPRKDWPAFSNRLVQAMARWRKLGFGYDSVPLESLAGFEASGSKIAVTLRQPADIGTLHYALDGRAASASSPAYHESFSVPAGANLSVQSFLGRTPLGTPEHWVIGPELLRTRTAIEMELCTNAIPLRLEDDGPPVGRRAVHWVDIMHPCWIWRGAPLDGARRVTAQVGRLPFNFAIGDDIHKISFEPPATAAGELHVRRDGCDGPIIATVPLAPATATTGVASVTGSIAGQSGKHDLCMTFTQNGPDPFWVLDRLTLQQ
jgi:hexosaminidase